jgi:hypothetical protein
MPPHVTVIVLSWNNATDTLACLDSLAAVEYPDYRVLVVDNGSEDGSPDQIRDAWPEIELLETGANLGYAGGNNAGIRRALAQGADYVCLLNNDLTVAPDFLGELVRTAESDPQAGLLGPKVYRRESPDRLQSAGMAPRRAGQWELRGLGELDEGQYDSLAYTDVLSGCALFVGRGTLERIGLLDERFYLYDEDLDWCLCALEAGYRNRFVPGARVYHRSADPDDGGEARRVYYISRNRHLLYRKHRFGACAYCLLYVQHAYWLSRWTFGPDWRAKRAERDALLLAVRDGLLGRFGQGALGAPDGFAPTVVAAGGLVYEKGSGDGF